ncbi:uracil-DNA glycosylase family protein [Sphingomonas desiccabilis]|uniref:Uracil-DNA glycosylase n=1 Tax=Sphingomonas desiccabilis TaxID=429134 RepID=A0A4Q2J0K8_9SPHN|nr:uracil-DNA glycosylase family protein [Sphingomonas desiccabilis]MBB3910617.1 DNA polymerase [Sphingomonas desiccabilis]RXZ35243.1 uracil-DNA glycosylase [Sphingomonas desiccabilis]
MGADQHLDWRNAAASTLDWWVEAGVDTLVDELPRDWLVPEERPAPASLQPAAPAAEPLPGYPATYAEFVAYRMGDLAPDARWAPARVGPSGDPATATLMVLTDVPEEADGIAGHLLAGTEGRLLDRMLAAIGISREQTLLASVCVARPLAGRVPRASATELEALARHLVGIVRPKRLLLLGQTASRAVLGTNGGTNGDCSQALNDGNLACKAVATYHPRVLLERPMCKAEAWRDLQLLIEENDA